MDDISTRTVIIAVNIFITITIVTLVIIMFSQMSEIYGVAVNTDISIKSGFDDIHSMYHGRVESGIGLLNTIKKYEEYDDLDVIVEYPQSTDIRDYIEKEYNVGRDEQNQITEATYLKIRMEIENGNEQYRNKYRNIRKIGTFKYEDKYDVTVENGEDGKIRINYDRRNR